MYVRKGRTFFPVPFSHRHDIIVWHMQLLEHWNETKEFVKWTQNMNENFRQEYSEDLNNRPVRYSNVEMCLKA